MSAAQRLRSFIIFALLLIPLSCTAGRECDYQRVKRVIDGDTFIIRNGDRVRLIGVDTPETLAPNTDIEWYGREASARLKRWIGGKEVCLKRDRDRTIDRDRYGRLLRYVWIEGLFINEELLRQGYASAYTRYPFQYLEDFRGHERRARSGMKGLWNWEAEVAWSDSISKNRKLSRSCGREGTICPEDAINHPGEERVVRFFVKRAHDTGRRAFLNSRNSHRHRDNFTVMIKKSEVNEGDDIAGLFLGKTVDAAGRIKIYDGRAEIVIRGRSGISLVQ